MSPLERLLEEARDVVAGLAGWKLLDCDLRLTTLLAFAATFTLALTSSLLVVAVFPFSLALIYIAGRQGGRVGGGANPLHAVAYPLTVSLVAAMPKIVEGQLAQTLWLLFRVLAPAVYLALLTWAIGWKNVVEGLRRLKVPSILVDQLEMMAMLIPRFVGQLIALMMARRARHLGEPSGREWWKLQATVVGELLVRALHTATNLAIAVEARTLGPHRTRRREACGGWSGVCMLLAVSGLAVVLAGVAGYVLGY